VCVSARGEREKGGKVTLLKSDMPANTHFTKAEELARKEVCSLFHFSFIKRVIRSFLTFVLNRGKNRKHER
jgi:hypothetical protein